MKIYTIWVKDKLCDPWMHNAWDEYSVDENYKGYEDAVSLAKDSHDEVRIVIVESNNLWKTVLKSFTPNIVSDGSVDNESS